MLFLQELFYHSTGGRDGDGDGDTDTTTKENKTKPPTFSRDFDFSLCRSDCMLQRIIIKKSQAWIPTSKISEYKLYS